ncbi:TerB N-terminal domain-containing protein [Paenibacillus xylanexedens]|uniref:TerB N-terminal domain-containing protein n=1 Tax=Paenibacillus xylanexedens TaxID=528191 RepID=UPI001C92F3C0|nr:TerB N-terminal domain-containing protein [Paenibacillus xylanexedens]
MKYETMEDNSRQLEFTEIDLSEDASTTEVPIPERSTLTRAPFDKQVTNGGVLSSERRFAQEARQYIELQGEEAPFVPFMSYWPTYGVMSESQQKWYFYWRSEVRAERYMDTDLSYLFVHIYELINGIGWQEPEWGYEQLKRLWVNYRERFPQLDVYMQDWLVDYGLVHQVQMSLTEIMNITKGYLPMEISDMELHRLLTSDVSKLSLNLLSRYYEYDITLSKFYRDQGQLALERYIPQVMVLMESYLQRTRGVGLIDHLQLTKEKSITRALFRKAVYDDTLYGKAIDLTFVPVGDSAPFCSFVTRIFRCTENKLRELLGFRGRLRGKTLDTEFAQVIERYLDKVFAAEQEELKEKPMVRIDQEKLAVLQQESDYVREALMIDEHEYSEDKLVPDNQLLNQHEGMQVTEEHILPKMDEVKMTLQLEDLNIQHTTETMKPYDSSTDMKAKEEDFTLKWKDSSIAELDDEWILFADVLASRHVQAIYALLGDEPDRELVQVAERNGTMPTLLLDEINDAAMETIGDLLIDNDRIVPEYITVFEHVKR